MFWLPTATPFVIPVTFAPPDFKAALDADAIVGDDQRSQEGGRYVALGPPGLDVQLTLLEAGTHTPLALLLPIDADLPTRLEIANSLWRWLSHRTSEPPGKLTPQRRKKLVETLRALDGHLADASIREIAAALFGEDRLPPGREWKAHDLRSRTRRLVCSGRALMQGGYRSLLRAPKRRGLG